MEEEHKDIEIKKTYSNKNEQKPAKVLPGMVKITWEEFKTIVKPWKWLWPVPDTVRYIDG